MRMCNVRICCLDFSDILLDHTGALQLYCKFPRVGNNVVALNGVVPVGIELIPILRSRPRLSIFVTISLLQWFVSPTLLVITGGL